MPEHDCSGRLFLDEAPDFVATEGRPSMGAAVVAPRAVFAPAHQLPGRTAGVICTLVALTVGDHAFVELGHHRGGRHRAAVARQVEVAGLFTAGEWHVIV